MTSPTAAAADPSPSRWPAVTRAETGQQHMTPAQRRTQATICRPRRPIGASDSRQPTPAESPVARTVLSTPGTRTRRGGAASGRRPPRQHPPESVTQPEATRGRLRPAIRELLLVAGLFLAYRLGRQIISGHVGEATANAASVWRLERRLHLPSELTVQHALLRHDWLVTAANSYYAYVHFPATAAVLIWLYLFRPQLYRSTRRILAWLTATALIAHVLFPLAPARLVPATGLLDTGALYGPSVYGPPDTDTLTNQYAAMPSLHVGWALTVAVALVAAGRGRWRCLWLAHPLITLLVVVSTGNHYWLDALVAVTMLAATAALVLRFRRRWLRRSTRCSDSSGDEKPHATRLAITDS